MNNNKRIHMVIYGSSYVFSPIFKSSHVSDKFSKFGTPRLQICPRGFNKVLFTDDVNKVFNVVKTDTLYIFEDKHE